MVYKIAMIILRNPDDAEDAVQNTFIRYYRKAPPFQSSEHEKAWLIRVGTNAAKSIRSSALHHAHDDLENVQTAAPEKDSYPELLTLLSVNERIVLQLRYVEGYTAEEIARILEKSPAAIRKRLERARARARQLYHQEVLSHA